MTVPHEVLGKHHQKHRWGSKEWRRSYNRRIRVEQSFGLIKGHADGIIRPGWTLQVGHVKTSLLLGIVLAAHNLSTLLRWARSTGWTHDPLTRIVIPDNDIFIPTPAPVPAPPPNPERRHWPPDRPLAPRRRTAPSTPEQPARLSPQATPDGLPSRHLRARCTPGKVPTTPVGTFTVPATRTPRVAHGLLSRTSPDMEKPRPDMKSSRGFVNQDLQVS